MPQRYNQQNPNRQIPEANNLVFFFLALLYDKEKEREREIRQNL